MVTKEAYIAIISNKATHRFFGGLAAITISASMIFAGCAEEPILSDSKTDPVTATNDEVQRIVKEFHEKFKNKPVAIAKKSEKPNYLDLALLGYEGNVIELGDAEAKLYGQTVSNFIDEKFAKLIRTDSSEEYTGQIVDLTVIHYVQFQNLEKETYYLNPMIKKGRDIGPNSKPYSVIDGFPCDLMNSCHLVLRDFGVTAVLEFDNNGSPVEARCFVLVGQEDAIREFANDFELELLKRSSRYQERLGKCLSYFTEHEFSIDNL